MSSDFLICTLIQFLQKLKNRMQLAAHDLMKLSVDLKAKTLFKHVTQVIFI